ncbi:NAD(P)-binding domain-containing protein [Lichenibacterium dinghuense]|uniref:NAD(P)-binding domain-containing protein n=1 Tax=Lichenibacterium dinghuense TaxID=2895977 RepID=UPI001F45F962|nr:NAD(P)-binding domain-containing protein [Lichenibacterium sp. 6Y81]
MSMLSTVAVVGAGPYGLSVAAHLAEAGVEVRVFGDAMQTWREGMPRGMFLKSEGFASSLSDPGHTYTLKHFCAERGIPYADVGWPVPVEVFAAYGDAFARRFVPGRDRRSVARVARAGGGFRVELADGDAVTVGRVVLATGIGAFARVPEELEGLPRSVLTHSSHHADYAAFAGQAVAVIGAGASALDAAAALRRAGASATLVSRRAEVRFYEAGRPRRAIDAVLSPLTPLGPGWKKWLCCEAPQLFHALPERLRLNIVRRYLGPSPARFVRDTIEGHVPYWLNSRVLGGAVAADGRVALSVDTDGVGRRTLAVDHVVAATGYKVDVARLGFLDPALAAAVRTVDLSPALSRDFESSVPGLYFVGTPSAYSFGPMFRFACGADYAARRLTRHVLAGGRSAARAPARTGAPALRARPSGG